MTKIRSCPIVVGLLFALWASAGNCYVVPDPKNGSRPTGDSPLESTISFKKNQVTVHHGQVPGSDDVRWSPWAGANGRNSKISIFRNINEAINGRDFFEKNIAWCLPPEGPGSIGDAINDGLMPLLSGITMNGQEQGNIKVRHDLVYVSVGICGEKGSVMMISYADFSPTRAPAYCTVDMQREVDLGVTAGYKVVSVPASVGCNGAGDTTVRVRPRELFIHPAPGVQLFTGMDTSPINVPGDGSRIEMVIQVGADVDGGAPGTYSGHFVYDVEYQ